MEAVTEHSLDRVAVYRDGKLVTRKRRTARSANAILVDVLDALDEKTRQLRDAHALARTTLSQTGETLAAGSVAGSEGATTALRNPSHMHAPEPIPEDVDDATRALLETKRLKQECWRLVEETRLKAKPNMIAMASFIEQIRRLNETEIKLRKEVKDRPPEMPAGWANLRDRILTALQAFPAAHEAVLAAIGEK